jgi:cyclopropane fatty-acyl-phospholipid synthase-like methyltransferase
MDRITLLDTDLLRKENFFNEVVYWKKFFGAQPGWHYVLDLIWKLEKIDHLNLPERSVIMDAGAGYGLIQYILAGRGFDVISVDFAPRKISWPKNWIFPMKMMNHEKFEDDYIRFLKEKTGTKGFKVLLNEVKKTVLNYNFRLAKEIFKRRKHGTVYYYQANFKSLKDISSNSVDAIVSTSSVEHVRDLNDLKIAVSEFLRVLKKDHPMFITTSAARDESWYFEPAEGWCFSEADLTSIFQLKDPESNYKEYERIYQDIFNNDYLKRNIPRHYFRSPKGGLPYGKWDPQYVPVGIEKWKK